MAILPKRQTSLRFNESIWSVAVYALMLFMVFVFTFPILFMVISSFKPDPQIFADLRSLRIFLPVGDISLDNYLGVFERTNFWLFLFNSVFITVTTVGVGLVVNSMAAFSLSRLKWKGQAVVLSVIIATLIVPFEAIAIPLLMMVSKLPGPVFETGSLVWGSTWLNTYHVQIIPFIGNAFSIFLFYQFFKGVPKELDEAATVDGASYFTIFWRIIVPISGPVFATVTILQFLVMWNQFLWPVMVVQSEQIRPVMIGMQFFFNQDTAWGEVMAYATLITVPVLIIFLIFQRSFVESLATSGLKG